MVRPKIHLTTRFVILFFAVILLDQSSKLMVCSRMDLHNSVELIPRFLNLSYTRNKGVAFGLLSGGTGEHLSTMLLVFTLVATSVIAFLWLRTQRTKGLLPWGLTMLLAGAVGNLIDRARMGEVVDFIDVHWDELHWPAFNVADSAITVGAILLLLHMVVAPNGGSTQQVDVSDTNPP